MLYPVWNYLSPIKTSNPYDQSTHIMNHNSYVNPSISLSGTLYIKNKNSPIQLLSKDCSIYMSIIKEKSLEYSLNIKNNSKINWDTIQLTIDKDCKYFQFINRLKNKCFMIYKYLTFYILEIYNDDMMENKDEIFFEKLSTLISSFNLNVSISDIMKEKDRNKDEGIIFLGEISELNLILENYLSEEDNKSHINNKFQYINKKDFMKRFDMYKEIYMCKGNAFKYDKFTEKVIPIEKDNCKNNLSFLKINKIGYNIYILVIEQNDKIIAFTKIENCTDISINENLGIMSFISKNYQIDGDTSAYTFGFEDKSMNEINVLKNLILRCIYEKNNYIEDFLEIENLSSSEFSNCDIDIEDLNKCSFLSSKSKLADIEDYFVTRNIDPIENTKNKIILQSYYNNRTFVIKDNNTIDIFKTDIDNNKLINASSSINPIKLKNESSTYYNNKEIIISNAKMFNKDNEILFQDENNENIIWQYDLNKESIIQEWNCDINKSNFISNNIIKNFGSSLLDITYPKKYGQLNGEAEMIGINSNNIFLLDGRVNRKNKIVDIKNYSNEPNFKSIVTTGFGGIAIGSENGDIRLFNEVGHNAKTLLYGTESHSLIRYLDSTYDGKYILATCDKYIMVINTENEYNFSGFITCFRRTKKKCMILKISHNDLVKYGINNELFTPAKFNNNTNNKEVMIISSLGNFVILWDFSQVLKGEVNSYKIINVSEYVIGITTKFDKNQLVITLPDKLRIQNEKLL